MCRDRSSSLVGRPSRVGRTASAALRRTARLGLGLLLLPLLALPLGCVRESAAVSVPTPTAAPAALPDDAWVAVRQDTLRRYAPAIGSLRARQSTKLGSQVSGRVAEVLVDVGDRVEQGQVLLRLDPAFFEIEVKQQEGAVAAEQGALASAATDAAYWEREVKRQAELFDRSAGSQKELEDARTARDRAVAQREEKAGKLAGSQQALAYARQRLAECSVRAPFAGVITERYVDAGDTAASNPVTDLFEVCEVSDLYLEFTLPQELLSVIGPGTPLEFELEGSSAAPTAAQVATVFPAVDERTRTFRCRAIIANPDGRLQPGILARVRVVEREAPAALIVPRRALAQTAAGWAVFVCENGRPVRHAVELGLATDDWMQITSGLLPDQRVLASADLAK